MLSIKDFSNISDFKWHILKHSLRVATYTALLPLLLFANILLLLSSFLIGVKQLPVKIVKHFVLIILWTLIYLARKSWCQNLQLFRVQLTSFWHNNFKLNYKVAFRSWLVKEGHTELLNNLFAAISYNISRSGINWMFLAIEMCNLEIKTEQSFNQRNRLFDEKVSTLTGVNIMRSLLYV